MRLGLSFNAIFAKQLGWLNGQFIDMRAPATGMRLIKPFIGSGFSGQRAIRLQDGPTTLWIEYRRPIGIDGPEDSLLREFPTPPARGYSSGARSPDNLSEPVPPPSCST